MSVTSPGPSSTPLARDGWTRRFTAIGPRLAEAIAMYRELGFEVRLEPVPLGEMDTTHAAGCEQCFVMTHARAIYTRPAAARPAPS